VPEWDGYTHIHILTERIIMLGFVLKPQTIALATALNHEIQPEFETNSFPYFVYLGEDTPPEIMTEDEFYDRFNLNSGAQILLYEVTFKNGGEKTS
jgi:hypothetical protein